jgi:hypothetical protein
MDGLGQGEGVDGADAGYGMLGLLMMTTQSEGMHTMELDD